MMAMNAKLNGRIAEEVGDDNRPLHPDPQGKWFFRRNRNVSGVARNVSSELWPTIAAVEIELTAKLN